MKDKKFPNSTKSKVTVAPDFPTPKSQASMTRTPAAKKNTTPASPKALIPFPLGEIAFIFANIFGAIGISLQVNANLGVSMVAAPAYILSLKVPGLTFGIAEWVIQGGLFLLCCLILRRFVVKKLWSFIVAIPYGWVLDRFMALLEPVQADGFAGQLVIFWLDSLSLSLGIALFFRSYLPCQVYEMFVKTISEHKGWDTTKFKIAYDWTSLTVAIMLTLIFFHGIKGLGIGTVLCTFINGPLIALWGKGLDKLFSFEPAVKGWKKYFA